MTTIVAQAPGGLIRWRYAVYSLAAIALMVAVIRSDEFWPLNFLHVFSSLIWTGVDLVLGFIVGPILRRQDVSVRRDFARQLTPRTLFLMPTIAIISGTTGWYLAVKLGYTGLPWPEYAWVATALTLVTVMTIQGMAFIAPVNVFVCLELQKDQPDLKKVGRWMQRYFYAVAFQGLLQLTTIVVMTRFRAGL